MHRINLSQDEENQHIKQIRVREELKVDRLVNGWMIVGGAVDVGLIYN